MAVSGKTAAPHEIPYYLGGDKPPDMAVVTKAMADRTHARLGAIDLSQLVVPGGSDGKLLIVKDGAAAYKAMSGDGTIDEDGVFQLGAKVVGTNELGDKSVTPAKVDDGAVTAPKFAVLPSCRATRETAQSIPDSTYTPVSWTGGDRWDTESIHDPAVNPDRLTCKVAGLYTVQGFFTFAGDPDGLRNAVISVNEAALPVPGKAFAEHSEKGMEKPAEGAGGNAINISAIVRLQVGDIVRLLVWQNSGGALNIMAGDAVHIAEFGMTFQGARPA